MQLGSRLVLTSRAYHGTETRSESELTERQAYSQSVTTENRSNKLEASQRGIGLLKSSESAVRSPVDAIDRTMQIERSESREHYKEALKPVG